MNKTQSRGGAERMTELILEVFRLNARLLEAGDALVADFGLTSARWQALGAVADSSSPLPVASIARNMGLSRQAVQRIVNEMNADGLVRFEINPHHERARLVVMTDAGEAAYAAAMRKQRRWAGALGGAVAAKNIDVAVAALRALRLRLEES